MKHFGVTMAKALWSNAYGVGRKTSKGKTLKLVRSQRENWEWRVRTGVRVGGVKKFLFQLSKQKCRELGHGKCGWVRAGL
jgi:hypothetical protein